LQLGCDHHEHKRATFFLPVTAFDNFEQPRLVEANLFLLLLPLTTDKNSGMKAEAAKFARIITSAPLRDPLIYGIPEPFRQQIAAGMRVLVPLGRRKVTGVVLDLLTESAVPDTRDILTTLDERPILDASILQLAKWIAQYYLGTLGQVLGTVLPASLRSEMQRTVIVKTENVSVCDRWAERILARLQQTKGKAKLKTLQREIPGAPLYGALERLESVGAIEIRERLPGRREKQTAPLQTASSSSSAGDGRFDLSSEQGRALREIEARMEKGGFETFLLHGVTGSGKTEVYLRAMERARQAGRRSLILIPEISLTPQLLSRVHRRFPGKVGILHSGLSQAERWAQWWDIVRGNVDVVVGARSAVFAPLPDLGLVVVDEEHDPSYKQEEGIRYNGRDVAVMRGKLSGCPVILGSATPAIESYQNCMEGRYRLLEITERVQQRPLPPIETVDLRSKRDSKKTESGSKAGPLRSSPGATPSSGAHGPISDRLAKLLEENYRGSRQSLIFLNRRGFSNFLQCAVCGYVLRCSNCSVTLTFHRIQKRACCHHCNFHSPANGLCPGCGNLTLCGIGAGTEQVEDTLGHLVPQARVARMDRDTTNKRGSHESLIRRWEQGEIDILVGTQMITKGHDVTGVTLVGALFADLSLNLPDFRAGERTFQLLSQVAGRCGRGNEPGVVIVQTYAPDHYAIQHLIHHDYKGFFASEIEFRRELNYPPFSRLVCLGVDGIKLDEVETKSKMLGAALRKRLGKNPHADGIEILGPAPAPIQKLRNRYRWQLLLKGKQSAPLLELAKQAREFFPRSRAVRLHIDVDPYNML
jgi:primosomal protein N' (replication factor Y) (superfamily II helicase)